MKKIFLLLITLFLLTSCLDKKEEEKGISKDEFYKISVPENYEVSEGDLRLFYKMIQNDTEYFKSNGEQDFFYAMRDYLFGEDNTKGEIQKLKSCLEGKSNSANLSGKYKDICDGENKFIAGENINYFAIKDRLLKFKKIKDGEEFDCNYFIKDIYDYPEITSIGIKKNNYIICKGLQDDFEKTIKKYNFYYRKARDFEKCKYLNDKNLVKLCNENLKKDTSSTEK